MSYYFFTQNFPYIIICGRNSLPTRRLLYLRDQTVLNVAVQNSKRKAALALAHCVSQKRKKHNSWSIDKEPVKSFCCVRGEFELPKREVQRQQNSSSVTVWSVARIVRNSLKACPCGRSFVSCRQTTMLSWTSP